MKISKDIIKVETIYEVHKAFDLEPPVHPLISLIDASNIKIEKELIGQRISVNLYQIAIKDSSCGMIYGRDKFDFNEGVMIFTAPNQISSATNEIKQGDTQGKMLMIHPDMIAGSNLAKEIDKYNFWSYDASEALHLSAKEESIIFDLFDKINDEINGNLDDFSHKLIISNIKLLLEYSARYYNRQFITREKSNKNVVGKFEDYLKEYFQKKNLIEDGLPNAKYFADKLFLSPHYLSDLLKKETGRSIKDHINDFIIEEAKQILLSSDESVSTISYDLGFNYPHYFSRLFKSKTGMSPKEFRNVV